MNQSTASNTTVASLIATIGEMQSKLPLLVCGIHGTEASIARITAAVKKQSPRSDYMLPIDTIYGVPVFTHESEERASAAAWKQAVDGRCLVMIVEHDKYIEIDGAAMAGMLDSQKIMPYVFGGHTPAWRPKFF